MSRLASVVQTLTAPQHCCIYDVLTYWGDRTPDAPAILAPGRPPLTYDRLRRHLDEMAQTLHVMGIDRHDRVALVMPNGPEMAVACLAVAACIPCAPLNPAYSSSDFTFYLNALRPKALLIQQGLDTPGRAVAQALHIQIIELRDRPEGAAGLFTLAGAAHPPTGSLAFATPGTVAFLLHTSGTTSRPKIVPLTHTNVCTAAYNLGTALTLSASDRCLNTLPLFHTYGLIAATLTSLTAGGSVICPAGFDAAPFFTWLEAFCPTWYQAVPAVQREIVEHVPQHREIITRCPLRFIRTGTSPLPLAVRTGLESAFKVPLIEGWGMVEASGTVTCNAPLSHQQKAGSVGLVIGPEVAIMDQAGTVLPVGAVGEVVVRGPTVMQGYENDARANASAFTHSWFRSGDAGYLDADGYLFLTGRIKEIINRSGEKIAPQAVEDVLITHPAIAQAVVFAMPHSRLGEDVAAAVVLHQHTTATEPDIRRFAASRLADSQVPRRVCIVEALPTTPTGKLQRLGLAEKLGLTASDPKQLTRRREYEVPRTPTEEVLSGLWAQVFALDDVAVDDDFFRLGGDSLRAMQLLSRVWATWHVVLSFRSFFAMPTVAEMARSIEAARQTTLDRLQQPLHPAPRDGPLPLSYAQQRLWFLEQLAPSRAVYNLPLAWRCTGALNVSALEQSLHELIRRHAILRTTFPAVGGQARQVIGSDCAVPLTVVDLQTLPVTTREAVAQRLATEEARRPFDLSRGPLLRTILLRLSSAEHVLLITLHHIIFDGWSVEVFWRELATLYSAICTGQPVSLPALPLQYVDFAVWQRQWLQGEVLETQLAYWKQQLGAIPPVLELPTDRPHPPVQTFQGARQVLMLPASLTATLKALAQQERVTLFMTLVAVFQTLLYRYTGQTDMVIGTPVTGRTRVETEGLLGFFANTLLLRTDLSGHPRFRELLRRVRETTLGAYDHQELPFEKLVEALQSVRDLSRNPLVQVMIALQQSPPPTTALVGLTVQAITVDCGTAKFDLTLSLQDTAQGLLATVEYNTDLFDQPTIARMLNHFHILLEGIVANPAQRLGDIPLLTATEKQQLLEEWQNTATDSSWDTCLHELFEVQAEQRPDTVAVVCNAQQLTYDALNQRANRLAHYLRTLGVGPEVCVGLCVERSLELVVGLLGILKAGGAYVPLDPAYPSERLAAMVADAQVTVLVTEQQHLAGLPATDMSVVCLDTDWERLAQQSTTNLASGVKPADLAYVLYTSGSTGIPKGVMVEHRQVLAFLHGFEHVAPGGEGGSGTAVCPFGFDVSVWEYFSMLGFGGVLHLLQPDVVLTPMQFAHYLTDHGITSAYIPPALLADVARALEQQEQRGLQRLLVGVEPIPQGTLQRFRELSERLCIVNGYGPTETTVCATLFPFHATSAPNRRTPIGTGIRGYEVYLVDAHLQPVPLGFPGELLIGGAGLARGYINHPEFTAERFIPHPFSNVPGARLYKTGDLARFLPDGNLEFLERLDNQVKLRGYRIEPAEIEAALRHHPAVQEAVVLVQEDARRGGRFLVAYVAVNQQESPTPHAWRAFLQQKLPEYMIPATFVVLETLPRTPNGKLDRQALLLLDTMPTPDATIFVAPRTPTERILAGIWTALLGLERVSMHDNFFALGGDSILSIQIVARANQAGLRLTPKHLFQHQTIAALAAVADTTPVIETERNLTSRPVPLTPSMHEFLKWHRTDLPSWNQAMAPEDMYPLSPMQQGMLFHTLYTSEPGVYSVQWSCTLHGKLDVSAFQRAWQRVVDRYPILRTAVHWESSDEPFQVVYRHVKLPWRFYDWRSASAQPQQIEAFLAEERTQGFDLSQAPLMRLRLLQLAEDVYQCVWSLHHMLLDGWSLPLLLQEVWQFYEAFRVGQELSLDVSRPYGDYIAWLQQQDLSQAEAFWRQTLQGFTAPTVLHVGHDHDISASQETGCAEQQIRLSTAVTTALQALAQQHQLSLNTLVQGAWAVLLSRYSGQEDVVFGATVTGRPSALPGVEAMLGLFINTLPVRARIMPRALLLPWLQDLQAQQAAARQYEYSPLVQVQGWSAVPRGLPLFESLLVFENYPARTFVQEWRGSIESRQVRCAVSTPYPLTVVALPEAALEIRIGYQCQRFDAATITGMLEHVRTLLEGMITNPRQRLVDLPMLTQAERHQLLVEWNNTSTISLQNTCVHQRFEAQVARTPDAIAVVCDEQMLTYRELNRRANQLAHSLQALGVGPEVLVGICVERSLEMVVGLLGILKAGGAYVPLDPTYPKERLTFMLSDTQVPVLLTQQALATALPTPGGDLVCLDTDWQHIALQRQDNPVSGVMPENLVYVMYTSGSTGRPKGVMVSHHALNNHMHWMQATFPMTAADRVVQKTSLSFDASVWEVFAPLLVGGRLIVARPGGQQDSAYLVELLATRQVTMLKIVPALLQALLEEESFGTCRSLRHVFCGGEALPGALQEHCMAHLDASLHNLYGPTEATIDVAYWTCERRNLQGVVPIGRPIANTQLYVLDTQLQPVPLGVPGELYISGASLARGYLEQPELTAERFIPNPFSNEPGARLYKTGDLARYLPDGTIEFLGRLDNQVKLRGYRIELGEIETALTHHPAIRQAVVVAHGDTASNRRLVAYCVPYHAYPSDTQAWRSFLHTKLPDYMVPAVFVGLEAFPLTPSGKVNRQALPAPDQTQLLLGETFVTPRTPTEELLAGIWANVLGIESVGSHTNFFAVGGHSLTAMQVMSRLRKTFQVEVPLRALFEAPTVVELAQRIALARQTGQSASAPPLRARPRQEVIPLTMTQEHLWSLDRLLPGAPFSNMPYALRLTGPLNVAVLEQSFNEIIKRHEALRTTFTTVAGQPEQVIVPTLCLPLPVEDLSALPQAERDTTAQRLIRAATLYPFDLETGPLLQMQLLRLSEQEHILLLIMHHIISDGWSKGILLRELAVLYNAFCEGKPSPLPELPLQYADYAHWQRQWLPSEAGKAQLAYWTQQLHAPLPILKLPADRPRTGELSLHTARQSFQIPSELSAALIRLSHQESTTLFMTLVAAFKTLLYRYTRQDDIRVGTLVANRRWQETEGLIGLFANLVILRTNLSGNPTLRQVLQRVRTTTLDAYAYQDLPFEYLARTLVHARQLDRQSLFQAMFAMQNAQQHTLKLPALRLKVLETRPLEASACDLAVSVCESPQGLDGLCLYKTALFDATTITQLLADYHQILEYLIAQPDLRLSTLHAQ